MISHPQRIGHNGKRRIHGSARNKETGINHVKIIHLMRLALGVERGSFWVGAKTDRAILVSDSRERYAYARVKAPRKKPFVTFMTVHAALALRCHQALE